MIVMMHYFMYCKNITVVNRLVSGQGKMARISLTLHFLHFHLTIYTVDFIL